MLHCCIDAGITSQLLDGDHCAIFLKLLVMRCLKRKTELCQHIQNLDHQKLSNPRIRKSLCKVICLLSLTEARNDAMKNVFNRRTRQSTARLKQACQNLKAAVHEAKNKRIKSQCTSHWNKISLGCNKHLKRKIVENQTIFFQADETPMQFVK